MISKIAVKITESLRKKEIIKAEDTDLYEYALYVIFSYVFFLLLALLVGFLLKIPVESLVFYIVFGILRNFAGGVHAKTERTCFVLSGAFIIAYLIIVWLITRYGINKLSILFVAVSLLCFLFIKPVDNVNKSLSAKEKKRNHVKVIVIASVFALCFLVAYLFSLFGFSAAISAGMLLAVTLLILGKIEKICFDCKKKVV